MTIRDLGYRPYEGPRLPASNNTWVMLRQGLTRAWSSWLVKLAVLFGWLPTIILAILAVGARYFMSSMGEGGEDPIEASRVLRYVLETQVWLVVSLVTIGAGSSAIAEDLTFRAFPFYFSKPVLPAQYIAGRVLAVALLVFCLVFGSAFLADAFLVATAPRELALEQAGLLLPALVYSVVLALVMASASVAVSALSSSRALTRSAWITLFVVPYLLALLVDTIATAAGTEGGWPWLYLGSFTGLLGVIADALFKVESESDLQWFHAAPILAVVVGGALYLAYERVRRTEVIE